MLFLVPCLSVEFLSQYVTVLFSIGLRPWIIKVEVVVFCLFNIIRQSIERPYILINAFLIHLYFPLHGSVTRIACFLILNSSGFFGGWIFSIWRTNAFKLASRFCTKPGNKMHGENLRIWCLSNKERDGWTATAHFWKDDTAVHRMPASTFREKQLNQVWS